MAATILTHERLLEVVHYDKNTGKFTRKISHHGNPIAKSTGSKYESGYIYIGIDNQRFRAHRLAWFYVHGYMPTEEIDHINGIKDDNRLCNLREASRKQNAQNRGLQKNNASGQRGVQWLASRKKWRAIIYKDGRPIHLGMFSSFEEAKSAYQTKSQEIYTYHRESK